MGPTWPRPGNSSEGLAPGLGRREAGGLTVMELGSVSPPGVTPLPVPCREEGRFPGPPGLRGCAVTTLGPHHQCTSSQV